MKKILFITLVIVLMAGSAWAEDVDKAQAYATCSLYIENNVSKYDGTKVSPRYNYMDQGETHMLIWNMKFPISLANQYGALKKTGAICEVNKKTGKIVYLAVSGKEIIK